MKTLEEIELLSLEELEQQAVQAAPPAPEDLQRRLRATLAAEKVLAGQTAPARPRPARWIPYTALAAAACAGVLLALPGRGPRDSFDDPYLAYAEVEKAFQTISEKLSGGMEIAREAGTAATLPTEILNKTLSK
jgi:hypothetical protein